MGTEPPWRSSGPPDSQAYAPNETKKEAAPRRNSESPTIHGSRPPAALALHKNPTYPERAWT